MADIIKIRHGNKNKIPTLQNSELGYCDDTNELFIGTEDGNKKPNNDDIVRIDTELENINEQLVDNTQKINNGINNFNGRGINVMHPPQPLVAATGGEDDTLAIQNIINFAYDNGIGKVIIPQKLKITKPLFLWSGDHYTKKSVELIGENKINSQIIKTTHNGSEDGSVYDNIDAIIIISDRNKTGLSNYNNQIKNLCLNYDTTDTKPCDYGVYSKYELAELVIENCNIHANYCFRVDSNMWQCSFKGLMLYGDKKGFSMGASGTSNLLERCFVYGSTGIAYELRGDYSFANNLACDGATGIAYDFNYGNWTVSGLGCESPNLAKVINTYKSKVIINNPGIYPVITSGCKVFYIGNDSMFQINGGFVGNSEAPVEIDGYLFDKGDTNISFEMNGVKIYDTYLRNSATAGITSMLLSDDFSTPIRARQGDKMPYIGLDRNLMGEHIDKYNKTPKVKGKAIFMDCENYPTMDSKGRDLGWENKPNKGDLFLENNPLQVGAAAWVVVNNPTTFMRESVFAKVPITMAGTSAERPTQHLVNGQPYFDTTIGKPIWSWGNSWVDANGNIV